MPAVAPSVSSAALAWRRPAARSAGLSPEPEAPSDVLVGSAIFAVVPALASRGASKLGRPPVGEHNGRPRWLAHSGLTGAMGPLRLSTSPSFRMLLPQVWVTEELYLRGHFRGGSVES